MLSATTLEGVDDTVRRAIYRAPKHASDLAQNHEFDPDKFEVTTAYVFGSVAAGEAIPGESDIDIALCVPCWDDDDLPVDHPSSFSTICEKVADKLKEEEYYLRACIPDRTVTEVDIWIAEPEYNASHLRESVNGPVYIPEEGTLSPEDAAAMIEADAGLSKE